LIRQYQGEYGLNLTLKALDMPKSAWYSAGKKQPYEKKYADLRNLLLEIARTHPEYGYRRTASELRDLGYCVNRKVVEKLHKCWDLSIVRKTKAPGNNPIRSIVEKAGPQINLIKEIGDFGELGLLYTDFTEIPYQGGMRKAYLMPLVDHKSKLVAGYALGEHADTELALKAWEACLRIFKELGLTTDGIIIHHDQDGVYLGYRWLRAIMVQARARVSYSENGARGNVYMESFNGRFKEENRLLFWDQDDFGSLQGCVNERIRYYNYERRHSALGNRSPITYLKEKGILPESFISDY
jgi:putative transposase